MARTQAVQLDRAAVAAYLDVQPATISRYRMPDRKYPFPEPDGTVGGHAWWWSTTIDEWRANRVGNAGVGKAQPGAGRPRKS